MVLLPSTQQDTAGLPLYVQLLHSEAQETPVWVAWTLVLGLQGKMGWASNKPGLKHCNLRDITVPLRTSVTLEAPGGNNTCALTHSQVWVE